MTFTPHIQNTLAMEEIPVTRAYLESLTTNVLIRMADNWGIDIPPGLDRVFIIEELLDTASDYDGTDDTGPGLQSIPDDRSLADSVPLPKHYNLTFIEVMIRDPLWAFVFWEVKSQDKEQFEKAADFGGYYLRVIPSASSPGTPKDAGRRDAETEKAFTIPVKPDDTAWYLGLSFATEIGSFREEQGQFKVELCAYQKSCKTVLAVSNSFKLPGLYELSAGNGKKDRNGLSVNSLARLSGFGDFHIIRNNERPLRAKKGKNSGVYE